MSQTRTLIKDFLHKYAPTLAFSISALRMRHSQKQISLAGRQEARQKLFGEAKPRVLSGPFVGMLYIDEFTFGPIAPRWLGVYEPQLQPAIQQLIGGNYDSFIDLGAAEGYYAVGVARALPNMKVTTFDADIQSRGAQRRLTALNSVSNIQIRSLCSHKTLEAALGQRPFILCDIEGGELDLVDPLRVPGLKRADLVIEIHPVKGYSIPEVAQTISLRFQSTHKVEILRDDPERRMQLLRELNLDGLTLEQLQVFAFEARSLENLWLVLKH